MKIISHPGFKLSNPHTQAATARVTPTADPGTHGGIGAPVTGATTTAWRMDTGTTPPTKKISSDKVMMESIEACESLNQFLTFSQHLRMLGMDRYRVLQPWMEWVAKLTEAPDDVAIHRWIGTDWHDLEVMF